MLDRDLFHVVRLLHEQPKDDEHRRRGGHVDRFAQAAVARCWAPQDPGRLAHFLFFPKSEW